MLHPPGEEGFRFRVNQQSYIRHNPLWVKFQRDAASGSCEASSSSEASRTLRDEKAARKAIHSVGPWLPLRANQNDLPFKKIGVRVSEKLIHFSIPYGYRVVNVLPFY